jgi:hypothetical protein
MNPAETLRYALNAICDGRIAEAEQHLESYAAWRDGNGFIPSFGACGPNQGPLYIEGDMLAQVLNDALTLATLTQRESSAPR